MYENTFGGRVEKLCVFILITFFFVEFIFRMHRNLINESLDYDRDE